MATRNKHTVRLPEKVAEVLASDGKYRADLKNLLYSWKRFMDKEQITELVVSVIDETFKTH